VYNPHSGKEQIKDYLYDILQEFIELNARVYVYPTKASKDAYNYILENKDDFDEIICSGGDGTLNEVVSAVVEIKDRRVPIGYIPSGTTNDFARSMGIPRDMKSAANMIVNGVPKSVDIGKFNGKYFSYIAATGAFTAVSYATPQNMKNLLGHQAYIIEGVKALASIKPQEMTIITDKETFEGKFIYAMVTNTVSVAGYKGISGKNINLHDGYFECTFIRYPANPMQLQNIFTSLLMQDYSCDYIIFRHVARIQIKSETPIKWVLDGEFGGEVTDALIEVVPSAVDIIQKDEEVQE